MPLKINSIPFIDTNYIQLPAGTNEQKPAVSAVGATRSNTNSEKIEFVSVGEINPNTKIWRELAFIIPTPDPISFALQQDTGISATDNITKNGTMVVTGINVSNGTWQYSIDSGLSWSVNQPTTTNTFVLPQGTYSTGYIHVRQTNAVGYSYTATNSSQIVVDTTPPTLTINTISTDNILTYADVDTTAITGTVSDAGSSVTINFKTTVRTALVSGNNWSYTVTEADLAALGEGSGKTITASATDLAGNTGSASRTVSVNTWGSVTLRSSQSWSPPLPGIKTVHAIVIGGGSGGYGFYGSSGCPCGGGGGGAAWKNNIPVTYGTSYSATVGSGGRGGGKNTGLSATNGSGSSFVVGAITMYGGGGTISVDGSYGINSYSTGGGYSGGDGGNSGSGTTSTFQGASPGGASGYGSHGHGGDAPYELNTLAYGDDGGGGAIIIKWGIGRTYAN